jgi:hypothetical protein
MYQHTCTVIAIAIGQAAGAGVRLRLRGHNRLRNPRSAAAAVRTAKNETLKTETVRLC